MKKLTKVMMTIAALAIVTMAMSIGVFATEATVNVPKEYYGTEKPVTKTYTYTNDAKFKLSNGYCGVDVPIKVSEGGTIRFDFKAVDTTKTVFADLYADAACEIEVGSLGYYDSDNISGTRYCAVSKAGTYYLRMYTISSYDKFINTISFSAREYTRSDKTIKAGQKISYYANSYTDTYYFKYTAGKTGKATVKVDGEYSTYITLMNSKKKALSDQEFVSKEHLNNQFTFAVKKGTTYYFAIKTSNTNEINSISVSNSAVKEKSGSKKKKAVLIKAKKNIKGTILPGSKTADWYKFNNKKKKKLTLTVSGNVTGALNFTVYDKKGKKIGTYASSGAKNVLTITNSTTYGKANKGMYYVKVSRKDSKSSGVYSLKMK